MRYAEFQTSIGALPVVRFHEFQLADAETCAIPTGADAAPSAASRLKTSEPHPQQRTWPYLLRHPNQVGCADVTYIPMRRGLLYLVAVMKGFGGAVIEYDGC